MELMLVVNALCCVLCHSIRFAAISASSDSKQSPLNRAGLAIQISIVA